MKIRTLVLLKGVKEIVLSSAAVATVLIALMTVNDWKEETLFKHRLDLARNTLVSVYQLRDAMFRVRYIYTEFFSMVSFRSEERLEVLSPAILSVRSNMLETEVSFGNVTKEKLDDLLDIARKLETTFLYSKNVKSAEDVHKHFRRLMGSDDDDVKLFFSDSKEDEITRRIEEIIAHIETDLKPYLR